MMRFICVTTLLCALLATTCRARPESAAESLPSVAPLFNGFNDPNAIRYDNDHDARLQRMQEEWEPNFVERQAGIAATVDVAGEFGRVTKHVSVHNAEFVPLGRSFRSEDLFRFLDRRAAGELRGDTSQSLVRDICTDIDLCAQAEIRQSLPAMKKLLDDPTRDIRESAYSFIACVGPDDDALFARLSKLMGDPDMASLLALNFHRFGPRGLHVLLDAATRHPNRTVIDGIAHYPTIDQETVTRLAALLSSEDSDVLTATAGTLSHFGDQARSAIPAMIALHERRENYPYDTAYAALAQMDDAGRKAMMADARRSVRNYRDAMDALGSYGFQCSGRPFSDSLPILIDALRHENAEVRRAAAKSLGDHAAYEATPELIKRLGDPDAQVQSAAAWSLGMIGEDSAIPALKAVIPRNPEAAGAVRQIEWYRQLRK